MTGTPRSGRRPAPTTILVVAALAATVATTSACRDDAPTTVFPSDASLVGTWTGGIMRSIDDVAVNFSMVLKADSTASVVVQNSNPNCPATGPWTVSNGRLTVSTHGCNGIGATFTAPVTVGRMTGTWSADTKESGTFAVTKQ
ncbi:hypothetical protein J421_6254 (plasmid) [Gemmatirosa kalamazoonensis]|uniref:Uncharacterized protein n=1 Tax=Gemmatirosa kalamazoonensis TaxID=861299 RepID=W0RS41_9BACT|nr:hypothetical protein [Gemmatirosa kalamazoonensis]AHG93789.1 hypothetical protein J421_6254 [Gemmatirosa kalamazoonensis]